MHMECHARFRLSNPTNRCSRAVHGYRVAPYRARAVIWMRGFPTVCACVVACGVRMLPVCLHVHMLQTCADGCMQWCLWPSFSGFWPSQVANRGCVLHSPDASFLGRLLCVLSFVRAGCAGAPGRVPLLRRAQRGRCLFAAPLCFRSQLRGSADEGCPRVCREGLRDAFGHFGAAELATTDRWLACGH